jgi:hypothetical protein
MINPMAQSINHIQKKRGRPATGQNPVVMVRLTPEMIEAVDAYAAKEGLSRSGAIRRMVERALWPRRKSTGGD